MFVELQWLRFPIPFKTISFPERQLIDRISTCRRDGKLFISESKLSDRQVTILLSYLITCLLDTTNTLSPQPSPEELDSRPDEDSPKVVFYLCKGEQRKRQLLRIAEGVYQYVNRVLMTQQATNQFNDSEPTLQAKAALKIFEGHSNEEREFQELLKSSKGVVWKRLYIMPTRKFMQAKLKKKEEAFWKKCYDYGLEVQMKDQYNFMKKVDVLVMETNDLEGVLQDIMSVQLFEVHLHRANIEYRKLDKYYNYRQEEAKKLKSTSTASLKVRRDPETLKDTSNEKRDKNRKIEADNEKPQKQIADKLDRLKLDRNIDSKIQSIDYSEISESKMQEQKMEEPVELLNEESKRLDEKKQKSWSIAELDRKFNELYIQKKSMLQNTRTGYVNNERLVQDYMDCYHLMNLQTIGYLISYLLGEWANQKFHENSDNSQNFINYIYSKTLLSSIVLRKLKRTFQAFIKKNPPKLPTYELSYVYIEEVLNFFEKLVVWHQIFSRPASKDSSAQYKPDTSNGGADGSLTTNRLIVFREKVNKDSNLKLTTFDQKLFIELLTDNVKSICILQNLAYSFDYFQHVFIKPQKLKLDYVYRCPSIMSEHSRYTLSGLIVTATPNEEDLHIASETPQDLGKDFDDKKEDKELYSQIIRSYGVLIHDICELVPDGVVIYFPSRDILKECRAEWEIKENIYEKINKTKRIFEESEWERQNTANLNKFKKYCRIGRGAVFLVSAQSEFAKYETFYGFYSRCVVMLGVPYHPHQLQTDQKLKYLGLKDQFRFEEAMKNVNRCLNNCINSCNQVKTVVFADIAYLRSDIRKKWFPFIEDCNFNTLQVLDFISVIGKKSTFLLNKKKEEEERRAREEDARKKENRLDYMRRLNSEYNFPSFANY